MGTLVALQPSFLPWRGFFDLIKKSDIFIFYDHVQYDKNGWRNRNRIIIQNKIKWLTVPVVHKNKDKILKDVKIFNPNTSLKKILRTIEINYANHKNFEKFFPLLKKIILKKNANLNELNIELILLICEYLNININYYRSSSFNNSKDKNLNLIKICRKFNCNRYLTGKLALNYIDTPLFARNNISIQWHDYKEKEYNQKNNNTKFFFEKISIIDYIFNKGKNESKRKKI